MILLVVACGGTETPPTTATIPIVAPPDAAVATETPPAAPLTPGRQFEWVMKGIKDGTTEAEVTAHFHTSFLDRAPAAQVVAFFVELKRQIGEFTVVSSAEPDANHVLAVLQGQGGRIRVSLGTDALSGLIDSLLFKPDAGDKPKTFDDAVTMAKKLAPKSSLLVAKLDKGVCKPVHAFETKSELAIGSTFKLYVLLGLADQIAGKKLAWDQELAVRDDWKSLPSGVTQDDPVGTKHTIKALAERMISISDNTATDHILFTVGREKVEAALKTAKHAKPALNTPFLSTRDLFALKLGVTEEERERYVKAKPAARRKLLTELAAKPLPDISSAEGWTTGRHIEDLEWFASSDDLCGVLGQLWSRAQKPVNAPLLEVLSKNPGVPLDAATWPYIAFKGGSEPGVLNLTWLLRRADGQWFVVSTGFNAPAGAVDDAAAIGIATGLIDLVSDAAAAP